MQSPPPRDSPISPAPSTGVSTPSAPRSGGGPSRDASPRAGQGQGVPGAARQPAKRRPDPGGLRGGGSEKEARTGAPPHEGTIHEVADHVVETHRPSITALRELLAGRRPS